MTRLLLDTTSVYCGESADESPSNFLSLDAVATDVNAGTEDTVLDVALRVAGAALAAVYRFAATGAFRAIFSHANTADRTYTLPNRSVTLGGIGDAAANYTFNGDVEVWGGGTSAAPTGWTLTGAGASVAKNTTGGQFKLGTASAAVTRAGTDCYLEQDIDTITGFGPVGWWQSKTVTLGCWVRATVASRARLTIDDGVGTTSSSYHTGGSSLEFLTVTRTIDAAATKVELRLGVDTGNTVAQFDGAILVVGNTVSDFIPSGWRGRKAIFTQHDAEGSTLVAGATEFMHSAGQVPTEIRAKWKVPFKGVARNLTAIQQAAPGAGETTIYTVRKNTTDTALTVTVSGTNLDGIDTANEVEFAKNDTMTMKVIASGGAATIDGTGTAIEYEEIP